MAGPVPAVWRGSAIDHRDLAGRALSGSTATLPGPVGKRYNAGAMKILALETSCEHASIALTLDHETLSRELEGHANHSERLIPTVHSLLAEAGLGLGQIDVFAFGAGPGAFTGVRLACAVAQGFAMGHDTATAPVCSLAALSLDALAEWVYVATDARMAEAYAACYRVQAGLPPVELVAPVCAAPHALPTPAADVEWMAIGSAFSAYRESLSADLDRSLPRRLADHHPRAAQVAEIARHLARQGLLVAPEMASPLYVRNKVALTTAERLARGGRA